MTRNLSTIMAALVAVGTLSLAPEASARFNLGKTLGIEKPLNKMGKWVSTQTGYGPAVDKGKAAADDVSKAAKEGATAAQAATKAAEQAEKTAKAHEDLALAVAKEIPGLRTEVAGVTAKADRALGILTWAGFGLLTALTLWVLTLVRATWKRPALLVSRAPATTV